MIEGILNDYEKVKVGKKEIEISELKDRIRAGEERLQIETRKLDDMTNAELADYFIELVQQWKVSQKDSATAKIPKENIENVETNKTDKKQESESEKAKQQKSKNIIHVSEKDCTDTESSAGKIPATPSVAKETTQEIAELPDDINNLLNCVADRYNVTPEAIYEQYLDLKELLGDYPLSRFKLVLETSVDGSEVFEGGIVRAIKLKYTDSIVYGKLRLYKLTEDNSKYDIIRECYKAELILCKLGQLKENRILSFRVIHSGNARLDKVRSKSELLGYFNELYYRIGERLAIKKWA